jgi:hypothetical protein
VPNPGILCDLRHVLGQIIACDIGEDPNIKGSEKSACDVLGGKDVSCSRSSSAMSEMLSRNDAILLIGRMDILGMTERIFRNHSPSRSKSRKRNSIWILW